MAVGMYAAPTRRTHERTPMDRRTFIQHGTTLATLLATGSLVACGDPNSSASSSSSTAPQGAANVSSIKVGVLGSPTDSANPATATSILDYAMLFSVHDSLVVPTGATYELRVAERIEPNADGSTWTLKVRDGMTFHDGTPVTAKDVLYSLNLYAKSPNYGQFFAMVDVANMSTPDEYTLVMPMNVPHADLINAVFTQMSLVVQDGFTDWGNNVGSGPYTLESFEPGTGAVLVANPNYWDGAPAIDRVELVAIADSATKAAALASGEVDYVTQIDAAAAATLASTPGVNVEYGDPVSSMMRCFVFNRSAPPFDNPDVIDACRLAVDRKQLVEVVAFGNAQLGNDMPGLGYSEYPTEVPQRTRDVAKATALFAEAGVTEFAIVAADFVPGIVASAELFVTQLAECGVTATVEVGDPATYFSDFAKVLSTPCQSFYYQNRAPLTTLTSYTGDGAAFNVFGPTSAQYNTELARMTTIMDPNERAAVTTELLRSVHDELGWLIWGYEPQIDASTDRLHTAAKVQGVPVFGSATLAE